MKTLLIILAAVLSCSFVSCDNAPRHHGRLQLKSKAAPRNLQKIHQLDDGSYYYRNNNDWLYYYLWFSSSDNGRTSYVTNCYSSSYGPRDIGREEIQNDIEQEVVTDSTGAISENSNVAESGVFEAEDAQMEAAVDAENAAAVESFENEGGNLGPDNDSESSSEFSDSSSDGGSSDSGGGDSGGGGE